MKVGDLVYVPYFKEWGVIVGKTNPYHDDNSWRIIYTNGNHSDELEENLEVSMQVGDLVKEIYDGTVGIIVQIGPDLIEVMFCYGPRSVGCPRWLRRDSLEAA